VARRYEGGLVLKEAAPVTRFVIAIFAVLLVLPAAGSAPKPKTPPNGLDYFPCRLGTQWVYDQDGEESVRTVTAVEVKGRETLATIAVTCRSEWQERFAVTPDGVFRRKLDLYEIDPPLCMLRLPAKAGEKWDAVEPPQPGLLAHGGRMSIGAEEMVTVPAGTFRAVPVTWEVRTWDGEPLEHPETYTYWYAAGVGVVQFRGGSILRQLKAFTPGPAPK
jgi:hypothetical protein